MIVNTYARMGWDWLIGFLDYGDEWRDQRRMITTHLRVSDVTSYQPRETFYARRLVRQLLEVPEHFIDHIRQ